MTRVKTVVAAELEALDRTARVRTTEYFNHTYAPDIVLSWRDQPDRNVYLRLERELDELVYGAGLVDDTRPMVLGLASEEDEHPESEIAEEAPGESMISSPQALDTLIGRKSDDPTASMLANALAQGGRGIIYATQARALANSVANGFAGAAKALGEPTNKAVREIEARLAAPQAFRLSRVLQAVWEGGEGRRDEFPGPTDLSGRLGKEPLQYLLDLVENDDVEFWRRVGRRVTIADLREIDISHNRASFHRLVQANLDVLEARACAVIDDPQREMEADFEEAYSWTLRHRRLALDCPGYFAILGESKPEIEPDAAGPGRGLSVAAFAERAQGWPLHEVAIHDGKEGVTHTSDEGPLDQSRLLTLAWQFGPSVEVRRAVVVSPSGRVTVDFPNATGTGQTRSRVLAADVLRSTLPLVRDVSGDDAAALAAALYYPPPEEASGMAPWTFSDDAVGESDSIGDE